MMSMYSRGDETSYRIFCPGWIQTESPSTGGGPPPHVVLRDQRSMYSYVALELAAEVPTWLGLGLALESGLGFVWAWFRDNRGGGAHRCDRRELEPPHAGARRSCAPVRTRGDTNRRHAAAIYD